MLIGGDNLAIIHKWIEYQRIISEFGLIVYPRPGFILKEDLHFPNTTVINAPLFDISATEIRRRLANSESISQMVPESVELFLQHLII